MCMLMLQVAQLDRNAPAMCEAASQGCCMCARLRQILMSLQALAKYGAMCVAVLVRRESSRHRILPDPTASSATALAHALEEFLYACLTKTALHPDMADARASYLALLAMEVVPQPLTSDLHARLSHSLRIGWCRFDCQHASQLLPLWQGLTVLGCTGKHLAWDH